jgi:hypothetical protein
MSAAFGVQPSVDTTAGAATVLPVRVLNAGSKRWDLEVAAPRTRVVDDQRLTPRTTIVRANIVATWVSATGQDVPTALVQQLDDVVMAPGGSAQVNLALTAPADPGDYLLLLDVVSPAVGPLSSVGSQPAIVRVTVGAAPTPAPATPAPATPAPATPAPSTPVATAPAAGSPVPGAAVTDTTSGGPKRAH